GSARFAANIRRPSRPAPCEHAQRLAIPAQVILTGPLGGITENSEAHFPSRGVSVSSRQRFFAGSLASARTPENISRIFGSKSWKNSRVDMAETVITARWKNRGKSLQENVKLLFFNSKRFPW